MDSLGLSAEGSTPLLGGSAAIYVAFVLGGVVGASAGALVAYLAGRAGHEGRAALLAAGTAIALSAVAGYYSEVVAEWWANQFFQAPLSAGVAGGALAGTCAGVAAVTVLRALRPPDLRDPMEGRFASLVGSLAGLWAGLGGGALGAYLALAKCFPFYGGPVALAGCDFTQGAVALGLWAGGASGALSAWIATLVLGAGKRPSQKGEPPAVPR